MSENHATFAGCSNSLVFFSGNVICALLRIAVCNLLNAVL